jgi:hypothetical protein
LDEKFNTWSSAWANNPERVADQTAQYNLSKSLYGQIMDYNMRGIDVGVKPETLLSITRRAAGGADVTGALQQISKELEKTKKKEEAKQRTLQALEFADAMVSVGNVPIVSALGTTNNELRKIVSLLSAGVKGRVTPQPYSNTPYSMFSTSPKTLGGGMPTTPGGFVTARAITRTAKNATVGYASEEEGLFINGMSSKDYDRMQFKKKYGYDMPEGEGLYIDGLPADEYFERKRGGKPLKIKKSPVGGGVTQVPSYGANTGLEIAAKYKDRFYDYTDTTPIEGVTKQVVNGKVVYKYGNPESNISTVNAKVTTPSIVKQAAITGAVSKAVSVTGQSPVNIGGGSTVGKVETTTPAITPTKLSSSTPERDLLREAVSYLKTIAECACAKSTITEQTTKSSTPATVTTSVGTREGVSNVTLPSLNEYINSRIPEPFKYISTPAKEDLQTLAEKANLYKFKPERSYVGMGFETPVSTLQPPIPYKVPKPPKDDTLEAMLAGSIPMDRKRLADMEALKQPTIDPALAAAIAASGGAASLGGGTLNMFKGAFGSVASYPMSVFGGKGIKSGIDVALSSVGVKPSDKTNRLIEFASNAAAGGFTGAFRGSLANNVLSGALRGSSFMGAVSEGQKFNLDSDKLERISGMTTRNRAKTVEDLETNMDDLNDSLDTLLTKLDTVIETAGKVGDSFNTVSEAAEAAGESFGGLDEVTTSVSTLADSVKTAASKINTSADELAPRAEDTKGESVDTDTIAELVIKLDELKEELDSVKQNVTSINVDNILAELSYVNDKVDDLITTTADTTIDVSSMKESIDIINASMGVLVTDVISNKDSITNNTYSINDTNIKLEGVETSINNTIDIIQDTLSAIASQVNGLQSQVSFTQLA